MTVMHSLYSYNTYLQKISYWPPTLSQTLKSFPMLWRNTIPADNQMLKITLCMCPSALDLFSLVSMHKLS